MKQDHDTLRYGEGNDTVGDFEDLENVRGKSGVKIKPTGPRGLTSNSCSNSVLRRRPPVHVWQEVPCAVS